MSKFDELKKQHKDLALNDLDLMKMAVPDQASKYVEVLAKLAKTKYKEVIKAHNSEDILRKACLSTLADWGIDYNYLETLETPVLWAMWNRMETLLGSSSFRLFLKFANLNERKLIDNNDVTSYKSFDEIEQAVSLAEMKLIDKELEKQIKKVYEDDEWLSLRPLSLEASMKYGANTKWCTTTNTGQYYARYSSRGVLIYNINKKTGYKVACFKNLSPDHDNEFSWWDVTDKKIEALDSEAPSTVLEAVRNEIKNHPYYNSHLMSDDEQAKLNHYKEGYGPVVDSGTRLNITGGFATIGTDTTLTTGGSGIINTINSNGTTIDYNPSTWTTTADHVLRFSTTNNVGIGTINPSAQLSVNGGNIEVNDGDIVFRTEGEERARLTPDGFRFSGSRESIEYQPTENERRLFAELNRAMSSDGQEMHQRLEQEMAEQLAEANERVAQKHLSLLDNIELGTVEQRMIDRMQALAGIETRESRIAKLDAEMARLRNEPPTEVVDNTYDYTKDIQSSLYEPEVAEKPIVHSSIWKKIKNTGVSYWNAFAFK